MNKKYLFPALLSFIMAISGCQDKCGEQISICGNSIVEEGEECDGENLQGKSCVDFKGVGATGSLKCSACKLDASDCQAPSTCGNGQIDEGEECDLEDLQGKSCTDFTGVGSKGSLKCTNECRFDVSDCQSAPSTCGNGQIDEGEECDTDDLQGKSCVDFKGVGATGSLKCSACKLDVSDCQSVPSTCGNGQIDEGEACDGSLLGGVNCSKVGFGYTGIVKCLDDCSGHDTSDCKAPPILQNCGNGILDDDEYCDGDQIRGGIWYSCKAYFGPGSEGKISCKKNCTGLNMDCSTPYTCGNGTQQINERCDINKEYGDDRLTCAATYGDDVEGNRSCNSLCRWSSSECLPPDHCGNGIIEPELGEQCDPGLNQAIVKTCEEVYGEGSWGNVTCNAFCRISYIGCFPGGSCGNGSLDNGLDGKPNFSEVCDGDNLNKKKCSTLGKGYSGTLKCLNNCSGFDFTDCIYTHPEDTASDE